VALHETDILQMQKSRYKLGSPTYFKCIEINKVSLSKLRVSFELAHVFAGPSVLGFGNQNMVTLFKHILVWVKYFI